jgi:hypothetical protein
VLALAPDRQATADVREIQSAYAAMMQYGLKAVLMDYVLVFGD